jgi:hypothetical protein
MADLDFEEEAVLALLQDGEELLAVVPGMRSRPADGEQQVLIAVTDRRVVVVGRNGSDDALGPRIIDVTKCSTTAPRAERRLAHDGGHLTLDLDDAAIARLWEHIDGATGSEPVRT